MNNRIDKEEIIIGLRKLGLCEGDKVIVHSSLKSMGLIYGGADTLIDALLEAVGINGLVMVPTFTYSYENNEGTMPYNKYKTPSQTGLVTDIFRRRRNAFRSDHPTHSVAAIGKDAEEYAKGHGPEVPPFDINTPIQRLAKDGGYILLIGVSHNTDSTIHVAECIANLPFLDIKNRESHGDFCLIESNNGKIIRFPLSKKLPACDNMFNEIEKLEDIKKQQKEGYVGNAFCKLIKGSVLLDILVKVLRDNPGYFLCNEEKCWSCSERKKRLELNIKR